MRQPSRPYRALAMTLALVLAPPAAAQTRQGEQPRRPSAPAAAAAATPAAPARRASPPPRAERPDAARPAAPRSAQRGGSARAAAGAAASARIPPVDPPPAPVGASGWAPAPVPRGDIQGPQSDRNPRTRVDFGVPSPPLYTQGQTFRTGDPSAEGASERPQGLRVPSPGGTVRLPF